MCRRHHDIISLHYMLGGGKTTTKAIQGFLTNTNRFVDRLEALEIARNANQLIHEPRSVLTSEDLW